MKQPETSREPLTVGILKETKYKERRAPLTPEDVAWLGKRFIDVEVESDKGRIYSDQEYKKAGAEIVPKCREASLLLGIKEPEVKSLENNKVYMVFSHTTKGQKENRSLLKACVKKGITLVDYEHIQDRDGKRLVFFGRFAGICGCIDALCYLGKRLQSRGFKTALTDIKPAHQYASLKKAKEAVKKAGEKMSRQKLPAEIVPLIIGVIGRGNVGKGVQEILDLLKPIEIHPQELDEHNSRGGWRADKVHTITFDREEKLRHKTKKKFYFEDYLEHPRRFESNLDKYLSELTMLIHTSFWSRKYPRLVPKEMLRRLYGGEGFRLQFIADIACDIKGSIECTIKPTRQENPVYTYDPQNDKYKDGYSSKGITILARDNLPTELPRDASEEFSGQIREYVYQVAAHGILDITNHMALPREIRNAVITQGGRLALQFRRLRGYIQ